MRGFTLLETLIAIAVFGVFLTGLLHAERAYRDAMSDDDRALRVQQAQTAQELLRADLGRTGYRHEGADLWVERGTATDRVGVRYLEDLTGGDPAIKTVIFDAGVDRQKRSSLYRQEGSGNRQPAVLGVRALRIAGFLDADGHPTTTPTPTIKGIILRLEFVWGASASFTVGFLNPVTHGDPPP